MFCHKCGIELPDESQFCRKCGQSQTAPIATTSSGAAVVAAPVAIPKSESRVRWGLLAVVVAVIAAVIWIAVVVQKANKAAQIAAAQQAARLAAEQAAAAPRQFTINLSENSFPVESNAYNAYKFSVPDGAYNVRLEGNFSASGGAGNDIEVLLLPEDDFVNWENRHPGRAYYNSGKATVGTIKVGLPLGAGIYELVFNNRFSLFTGKSIEAHATLTYTKVPDKTSPVQTQ